MEHGFLGSPWLEKFDGAWLSWLPLATPIRGNPSLMYSCVLWLIPAVLTLFLSQAG